VVAWYVKNIQIHISKTRSKKMKHGIKNKETWYTHIHMHQVIKNKLATRIYLQQFTDIGSQQEGKKNSWDFQQVKG
jgi:hypothetical protein